MTAEGAWVKRGLLVSPDPLSSWLTTHAMLPVPDPASSDGECRIYVTGRDTSGRGAIGRVAIDPDGGCLTRIDELPLISAGPLGAFDDSGVSGSAVVADSNRTVLYYTGWSRGVTVPFYVFLGAAISHDGGRTFVRASRAPILERTDEDPFLIGHPAVLIENGTWRMWYVSCSRWEPGVGGPRHYYHIKYAESSDGLHWRRTGRVCVDYASADEYAIARPWVVRDAGVYRMWFSHRGDSYRIGYAESSDGLDWDRLDPAAGIDVSPEGWDSEMVEYPCVFDRGGRRWMLYNGNGYGRTGIGLAAWT